MRATIDWPAKPLLRTGVAHATTSGAREDRCPALAREPAARRSSPVHAMPTGWPEKPNFGTSGLPVLQAPAALLSQRQLSSE